MWPFLVCVLITLKTVDSISGEEACEQYNDDPYFSKDECLDIGCCYFTEGRCWSAVGNDPCFVEMEESISSSTDEKEYSNFQSGEEACGQYNDDPYFSEEECLDIGCCFFTEGRCWSAVGDDPCFVETEESMSSSTDDTEYSNFLSGDEACEQYNDDPYFSKDECLEIGCCDYTDGRCWSIVGSLPCIPFPENTDDSAMTTNSDEDEIVLPTYGSDALSPIRWVEGFDGLSDCGKVTFVFGMAVCVTKKAWEICSSTPLGEVNMCEYVVNTFAQTIDNDSDGVADDEVLMKYMVQQRFHMGIPGTEEDFKNYAGTKWGEAEDVKRYGQTQCICGMNAHSCSIPSNRGASDTDRSTWEAAIYNTEGCIPQGVVFEEFFHLMNDAASFVYPELWGKTPASAMGGALYRLNGNCGWGYTGDWISPGGEHSRCEGHYAYGDETCMEDCLIIEGTAWAVGTYMGGFYTKTWSDMAASEWILTAPDSGMTPIPLGHKNAGVLQDVSPEIYDMVSDNTSYGHKWLPHIFPNGNYIVTHVNAIQSEGTYPGVESFLL